MNCRRCGAELEPGQGQVNSTVDQISETSLNAARGADGVCPLCGHYTLDRRGRRKRILFGLLKALLLVATAGEIVFYISRTTERAAAAKAALARMNASPDVVEFLGTPIKIKSGVSGDVRPDETGWKEARLTIPVQGPNGEAVAYVVGGKGTGPWIFSRFEVLIEKQHKKVDLLSGKVVEYDSTAYIKLHTQAAVPAEYTNVVPAAPGRRVPMCVRLA